MAENEILQQKYDFVQKDHQVDSAFTQKLIEKLEALEVMETKPSTSFINCSGYESQESILDHSSSYISLSSGDFAVNEWKSEAKSIKNTNKKLKDALRGKLLTFRGMSQRLLSSTSRESERISILNSELENLRKNLVDVFDESHIHQRKIEKKSHIEAYEDQEIKLQREEQIVESVFEEVKELQKQMRITLDKIFENEKEICLQNEENSELKDKLTLLEAEFFKHLTKEVNTEKASCACEIF